MTVSRPLPQSRDVPVVVSRIACDRDLLSLRHASIWAVRSCVQGVGGGDSGDEVGDVKAIGSPLRSCGDRARVRHPESRS